MRTTVPPTAWSGPIRSPPRPKSTPKAHSATGWRLPIQWTHLILGHFSIPNGIVGGPAGFVLESKSSIFRNLRTKNWLQLRCVHPIGAGVGDRALLLQEICRAARASSELKLSVPQAPLTRAHERVRGQQETPLSLPRPRSSMGAGRGYPVDTSHPRPFFESKRNRQGGGSAGFVLESKSTIFRNLRTKNWLQSRCVHPIAPSLPLRADGPASRWGRLGVVRLFSAKRRRGGG